jgi:hypothetical protein
LNIETAVYMSAKVFWPVKPRAGANEDTAHKPFRPVVAVRSTGIRGVVIVPIRTAGFGPDVDADLSFGPGSGHGAANLSNNSGKNKTFEFTHKSSS